MRGDYGRSLKFTGHTLFPSALCGKQGGVGPACPVLAVAFGSFLFATRTTGVVGVLPASAVPRGQPPVSYRRRPDLEHQTRRLILGASGSPDLTFPYGLGRPSVSLDIVESGSRPARTFLLVSGDLGRRLRSDARLPAPARGFETNDRVRSYRPLAQTVDTDLCCCGILCV